MKGQCAGFTSPWGHTLHWGLSSARKDAEALVVALVGLEGGFVSPAKPCLAPYRQKLVMIYCKTARALALCYYLEEQVS